MEKITIWGKEQLVDLIAKLPQEYRDNPTFIQEFAYPIESTLYWEKSPIDIVVSDDYKQVKVTPKPNVTRDGFDPSSHMVCTEYKLDEENNIEVIKSEGYLHEPDSYYKRTGERKPLDGPDVTGVLDTYYSRKVIDKDGIEMARSTFSKTGWPLTGTRYDDTVSLSTHLMSSGFHKPASWTADGPVIPQYGFGGHVSGVSRSNDNPAFANIYGYDISGPNKAITNSTSYIGIVHSEWPHTLRVDSYERIAKFEDGKLTKYDPGNYHENETLKELFKNESLRYEDALEASKTRETFGSMYEVLKQRLEAANQKYRQEEVEHQRSM